MNNWKTILAFVDEEVVNTPEEFTRAIGSYQVWLIESTTNPYSNSMLFLGLNPEIIKEEKYSWVQRALFASLDGGDDEYTWNRIAFESSQPYARGLFEDFFPMKKISDDWRTDRAAGRVPGEKTGSKSILSFEEPLPD